MLGSLVDRFVSVIVESRKGTLSSAGSIDPMSMQGIIKITSLMSDNAEI